MPDSIREQIIQAVQTRLGADCERVPVIKRDYEDDELTGLIDDEDSVEEIEYDSVTCTMGLRVQRVKRFAEATENRSVVANAEIAAIIAAVTSTDRSLGGLAEYIRHASSAPVYDVAVSDYVGVAVGFEVRYTYDEGDPFSNANST